MVWRRETLCMGNRRSLIKPCPCVHSGEDNPVSPHRHCKTREAAVHWRGDSEFPSVWRICHRQESTRATSYSLQGSLQKWHEGDRQADINRWKDITNDSLRLRRDLHRGLERGEKKQCLTDGVNCIRRKEKITATSVESIFTCIGCNWNYHFCVDSYSHRGINVWAQIHRLSRPIDAT